MPITNAGFLPTVSGQAVNAKLGSPDLAIHCPVTATANGMLLNGISGYFEGIDFIGGSSTFVIPSSGANLLTFVDCGFLYGEVNGFRSASTIDTEGAMFRCRAKWLRSRRRRQHVRRRALGSEAS